MDLEDLPNDLASNDGDDGDRFLPDEYVRLSRPVVVKLSDLERMFNQRSRMTAIYDIINPKRLIIDDDYIVQRSLQRHLGPNFVRLSVEEPKIDQTTFISRYPGLGAIIPTMERDDTWVFTCALRRQDKSFESKRMNLGFEINRNGFYMGRCMQESVWIFMVPRDYFNGHTDTTTSSGRSESRGPPQMNEERSRQFLLYLAKCFERLNLYDVYCSNAHADVSSELALKKETNIL